MLADLVGKLLNAVTVLPTLNCGVSHLSMSLLMIRCPFQLPHYDLSELAIAVNLKLLLHPRTFNLFYLIQFASTLI